MYNIVKNKENNCMKYLRFFVLIFCVCLLSTALLCGCSKKENIVAGAADAMTICELEQIEGVENLSDETIKALSVIIRTNKQNENVKSFAYVPNNKRIADLVLKTSGETISMDNSSKISTVALFPVSSNVDNEKIDYALGGDTWTVEIKKSKILSYLQQNNINLSNISDFKPLYSEDGLLTGIMLAGKTIPYETLRAEFGLKSNKITKISNSLTKIVVEGEYVNTFLIEKAEALSLLGLDYNSILKSFLDTNNA